MKNYHGQPLDCWVIEDEELKKVVTIIEELFPTECAAVYFTEFRMENGVRVTGFGKLRNRFEYLKTNLRAQGILKSARSQLTEQNIAANTTIISDFMTEKIKYLEIHSDDPDTVKLYWTVTF
ncbi:uncharacterized protein LOC127287203 [Leptopilina boulardi]|uniref:uncharacterized protein LOC127287203 n=1 Tax=Leptopilina boulardi TaxID=63433 RepID=UPI0021F5E1D0|nr:uncharacterized protein LOC127287203 [Leptopilina boulardi]